MSTALHNQVSSQLTPILLNDFTTQWDSIANDVMSAVARVGKSGWYILGQEVKQFEQLLAHYWSLPYAVGCASGLDALEIALRALGLKAGEPVLTTPLSAFATTLAIIRAGGIPVFVDIDASGLIDLQLAAEILKKNPDIRFFVPVHLYGHALDLHALTELKTSYNLHIVEDCAQAIGAKSGERSVGSVGEVAAVSFYPTKNLGCIGDGGALLMQNDAIYKLAHCLRDYGQSGKYQHTIIGLNSRLDELQAAILTSAFLPRLAAYTERRRQIAQQYQQHIQHRLLKIPPQPTNSNSVWHLFPILVTTHRAEFQQYLQQQGIQSAVHYPCIIPEQTALTSGQIKLVNATTLNRAQYFASHELSLPIHPFMREEEINRVITACNQWQVK